MATLVACGSPSHKSLIRVDQLPRDTHCPAGGAAVESGADNNDSGTLDADEVAGTAYICNGAAVGGDGSGQPSTLVRVEPEAAGAHCSQGGVAVLAGVDGNHNGALEDSEVASTSYVCDGAGGALVRVSTEPPGSHCVRGGSAIATGVDVNHNGMLEPSEITNTSYVCNSATLPPAGDVAIHAEADLTQLIGVAHLDGSLLIDATDLTALNLPELVSVEGNLTITTDSIASVKLTKLTRVGSTLDVEAPALKELTLPALVSANRMTLKGGTGVALSLAALTDVAGPFSMSSMALATVPDMLNWPLAHVGSFSLDSVTGFGQVTLPYHLQVDGDLVINNCDIGILRGTVGVHGDMRLSFDDHLSWFELGGRVDGTFILQFNQALSGVSGLPSINGLYMNGNNAVDSVSIKSLTPLDSLRIEGNSAITQITVSGVTAVREVGISSNDALTTLKLPQLRWAAEMDVQYNKNLPSCLKAAFDAQLAGSGVYARWNGNNDLATCN